MESTLPNAQSASTTNSTLSHGAYTVGWISALPLELAAARAMLDYVHSPLPQGAGDDNVYTLGSIGKHNVVLACLPYGQMGNNSAAVVAARMTTTFTAIRFSLMVGIGGGCPSDEHDIRLGDVVVSKPGKKDGGVIQFDFGRTVAEERFIRNGVLNAPPTLLLNAISAIHADKNPFRTLERHLSKLQRDEYSYPGWENDLLFQSHYDHSGGLPTCQHCDRSSLVIRGRRGKPESPIVHYGTIASGNQVMRHGGTRERLRKETGALCFEMEAAGLMNDFRCLVIRGICDYADSHKSKGWQTYAAATAAAYAKRLLSVVPASPISTTMAPPPYEVNSGNSQANASTETAALSCLPYQRNSFFSGRKSTLESIDSHFRESSFQQAYILQGMGGIGKTQIALEYAYQALERGFHVFWVNCTTPETLLLDFQRLQQTMAVPKRKNEEDREAVLRWLESNERWLVVFDNADDSRFSYGDWMPRNRENPSARRILFTARDERLASAIFSFKENVPLMNQTESLELFNKNTSTSTGTLNRNKQSVVALVQRLGNLPLAISLASSYLREYPWVTIEQYLELLQDFSDRSKLFEYKFSFSNYNHSIMSTWEVSFVKIQDDNPRAASILTVLGFLENKGIPFDRLKRASRNMDVEKLEFLENGTALRQSLGLLRSLALVHFDGQILSLHPLVHEWIQARLSEHSLVMWAMAALRIIYHAWVSDLYPWIGVISIDDGWLEHTLFALRALERCSLDEIEVHEECQFLLLFILVANGTIELREIEPTKHAKSEKPRIDAEAEKPGTHTDAENSTMHASSDKTQGESSSFRHRFPSTSYKPRPALTTSSKYSSASTFVESNQHIQSELGQRPPEPPTIIIARAKHQHRLIASLAELFSQNLRPKFGVATDICSRMAHSLMQLRFWWQVHKKAVPRSTTNTDDIHFNMLKSVISQCDSILIERDAPAITQFPPHAMKLLFIFVSCAAMNFGISIEMAMETHIQSLKIILLQRAYQICQHIKSQSRENLLPQAAISYARFVDQRSLGPSNWLPVQYCLMESMDFVLRSNLEEAPAFLDFVCQSMWELGHELALWKLSRFIVPTEGRIGNKWMVKLSDRWKLLGINKDNYKVRSESEKELLSTLSAIGVNS